MTDVAGVAAAAAERGAAVADAGSGLRPAAPAVDAPAIETRELRKQFGRIVALAGLTMTVRPGEVFGFLGPNGAGKTTAVKLLLGLSRPSAGEGRVLGAPLGEVSTRRRIGYLPELFRYQSWMTAREVLSLHCELAHLPRSSWETEIREAVELVGLAERSNGRVETFSKGWVGRIWSSWTNPPRRSIRSVARTCARSSAHCAPGARPSSSTRTC